MKLVQRGNKQLQVTEDRVKDMLTAGYVEIDSRTGKPITPVSTAKDNNALKEENDALRKENKDLKAQLEAFTAKDSH